MPAERPQWLPRLVIAGLLALLALAAWQWRHGPPLSTDLLELVPGSSRDALQKQAEQRMQEPLNRELIVLVGYPERDTAIAHARELAERWQASGLYEKVQWGVQADLSALREQLRAGRLALLSDDDRRQLAGEPAAFIQQRVEQLFDPFSGFGLVPNDQDWFGLALRIQHHQPLPSKVQLDIGSGALIAEDDGRSWVLLRARTRADAFDMNLPRAVAAQVAEVRQQLAADGGQLVAASGLLYAADGQRQASREMTWVGGGAALGTLLLLLLAFRRIRALLAFLPVLVGVLAGATACIALFGKVNLLTLVLGASLIGVASDYPLHYLSKAWTPGPDKEHPWQPWRALKLSHRGLLLSLLTNLIGYLALACTPFPALTQVATFSVAGLLAAYLCVIGLLPLLLRGDAISPQPLLLGFGERLIRLREALIKRTGSWPLLAVVALFCAGGLWQLQIKNDLRQWLGNKPQLLAEAQATARITGYQPTSQFFLVRAADETRLLQRQAELAARLDRLVASGQLKGYLALNQLLATAQQQQQAREALRQLPQHWQALLDLGIPQTALQAELDQLEKLPQQSLDQALKGPLGEPWRPLWLGTVDGGVAGLVSLQGLSDAGVLAEQAKGLEGVQLVDRLGELNRLFAATQVSATELKLLSCVLIFTLLLKPFGPRGALRIVLLPLLAALCSLASLGWLGQPLTLFSLFGLLLVTAIGVDYTILMRERVGGAAVSLIGVLLAAITTWLSFGLLALSSTPVISNFGLAVGLGLAFCFLFCPWAGERHREGVRAC
ncbi:membrane protein [Pseudomonas sp. 21]|uniref:MMPL family transporter n=1 Tax=unclassified Pseudomonas TaxID=196821 RepID=UPI0005EB3CF1|nr:MULTISPECIES: MMPL family transporter [unclassified Pseudomonas]KJJ97227.1 membrane protein [Pseudomonas sp. 21]MBV7583442.1 MMPL family transporter [Pseudomonas sp. PDM33]